MKRPYRSRDWKGTGPGPNPRSVVGVGLVPRHHQLAGAPRSLLHANGQGIPLANAAIIAHSQRNRQSSSGSNLHVSVVKGSVDCHVKLLSIVQNARTPRGSASPEAAVATLGPNWRKITATAVESNLQNNENRPHGTPGKVIGPRFSGISDEIPLSSDRAPISNAPVPAPNEDPRHSVRTSPLLPAVPFGERSSHFQPPTHRSKSPWNQR